MNKVLIVSSSYFPNGNAGALRQHSFAKLFETCGFSPFIIGMGDFTGKKHKNYDGIDYISFRAEGNSILNRISNLILYKKKLKNFLEKNMGFSKIIVVSIPPNALLYLRKYAVKNNIEIIHDSVEWYSPEEFLLGRLSPLYIINNLYNTKWINRDFKVVAISSYLEKHFSSRKIDVITIPVIMDIKEMSCKKRISGDKLILVYAGSAGKKDYLKEIVQGLALLNENEISKVELRVFGVSANELVDKLKIDSDTLNYLSSSLICFGRVNREEVLYNLEEADFTVLLRPTDQRYAKAGFPTKVVESLGSGTPVICNLTSDLSNYIEDMVNGIVVSHCNEKDFVFALRKALSLTVDDKNNMKKEARTSAEKNFDYRMYVKRLGSFLGTNE